MATKREVKQFVLGKDFTEDEIELLILRLARWFRDPACDRRFDDAEAAAKDVVHRALNALTKDGNPWKGAPNDFAKRIKVLAAYDMEKGEGIPIQAVKHPDAQRRLEDGADENKGKVRDMEPSLHDFDSAGFRADEERKLLSQYPELNNPVMLPHVRRLSLLYAQQEMMDRELLFLGRKAREDALRTMETLNKTLDSVLKILDIHPESLRKKLKETEEGDLGDLVQILDSDESFPEREKLWSLQAALQFWYMTQHRNGRGDGPQLSEWELWHMTRSLPVSFTCSCGQHYPAIVRGFTPKQLKAHLIEKGVLIAKPAIPKLIQEEDLEGIEAYIDGLPDDSNIPVK